MLVTGTETAIAPAIAPRLETFHYDNTTVRNFAVATAAWGIVAFIVGLVVAAKLVLPELLGGIPQLSYGRLRPLHTNAAIFAFAGNAAAALQGPDVQRPP